MFQNQRKNYLKVLILENCGIDDTQLAEILKAVQTQEYFRSFKLKYNEFLT